jgi:hypothetical protein
LASRPRRDDDRVDDVEHHLQEFDLTIPARASIHRGVISGAAMVVQDVIVTDRATSPPDRYAITFEARPLGEQPIR